MKNYTKCMFLLLSVVFIMGCSSTKTIGEVEMSRGDNGSKVGISNICDGPEVYGSIRTGVSFK